MLTFSPANWNSPQSITVLTTTDDTDVEEGDHSATVTHAASSTDVNYNGISIPNLTVTLSDNVIKTVGIEDSDDDAGESSSGSSDSGSGGCALLIR